MVEQATGIALGKIFPLQQRPWKDALDGLHESLNKSIVVLAADARMVPANVEGIVEQFLVIGSHVQDNG